MISLFFFLSLSAFAASDSSNAFEKAYPRDNTFCTFKNQRIEFLIRGGNEFTEPKENGYGEYIFIRRPQKKPQLLELNSLRGDTYSFFLGTSPLCSKSHGYKIDESTVAILFKKENRPFMDKLVIQLFDMNALQPKKVIETNYPVERAHFTPEGFAFKTIPENHNPEIGKVTINGNNYIFQEKNFPVWINYSSKGFEISPEATFSKFPWKKGIKDLDDFLAVTDWNPNEKKFAKTVLYLAVNHQLKKQCFLMIEGKRKILGNEMWRCYAI